MDALLFAPHNDDETLFAAFTCQQYKPLVIVVTESHFQPGDTAKTRAAETKEAAEILGCETWQWDFRDAWTDWKQVEARMRGTVTRFRPALVFAPAVDFLAHGWTPAETPGLFGLYAHDMVGYLADRVFGPGVVRHYQTYNQADQRVTSGQQVIPTGEQIQRKLCALTCYRSQMDEPSTAHHFLSDQREWMEESL